MHDHPSDGRFEDIKAVCRYRGIRRVGPESTFDKVVVRWEGFKEEVDIVDASDDYDARDDGEQRG